MREFSFELEVLTLSSTQDVTQVFGFGHGLTMPRFFQGYIGAVVCQSGASKGVMTAIGPGRLSNTMFSLLASRLTMAFRTTWLRSARCRVEARCPQRS